VTALERAGSSHPIAVLRDQLAPEASDQELAFFAQVCARLDLSPFADQIVLIGRYDNRLKRKVHRHQITVAGRRTLATRTGRLAGIEGPVWCGPRNARGELEWTDVWDDDERPPYCARVLVYVKDWVTPANGTAKWSEFVQTDQGGVPTVMWRRMPSHMLGKVAESMALRRAFPDVIDPAVADTYPAGVDEDDVELAELLEASAANPVDEPPAPTAAPGGPAAPDTRTVTADWTPGPRDQADAHRAIALLREGERDLFLRQWDIGDFGDVWPPAAVADALGIDLEASA
jgi:phage recombination protein Bet